MNELIREIFRREGLPIGKIRPVGGGQVNAIYRVGREFILRLGRREDAAARLQTETGLLRSLAGQVPVPEIVACGQVEDTTYQVQRFVRGRSLYTLWPELTHRAQERIVAQLAEYLQVLHARQYPAFGLLSTEGDPRQTWEQYLIAGFRAILAEYGAVGIATAPGFFEMAEEYVETHASALAEGRPVLVHRDLWLGNILMAGGKITALLDFEYAMRAPCDFELLKPHDFCLYPNDYAEEDREIYCAADYAAFFPLLRRHYPALFDVPRLGERLNIYQIYSTVHDYLAWRKSCLPEIPPERMDAGPFYKARITNFIFENGVRLFR